MQLWLSTHKLQNLQEILEQEGYSTLDDLHELIVADLHDIGKNIKLALDRVQGDCCDCCHRAHHLLPTTDT
jgi:hypothetical protein